MKMYKINFEINNDDKKEKKKQNDKRQMMETNTFKSQLSVC